MNNRICGYILGSVHEKDRTKNISFLKTQIQSLEYEEAIYPKFNKIPFIKQIKERSYARTGSTLKDGEIGCLLSHRRIWKKIASSSADSTSMFLVLESDSCIQDLQVVGQHFEHISQRFDLFFWGAWEGHMKLCQSTKKSLSGKWVIGEPFIKTIYCTYGYSLNKQAASYLLQQTRKVGYPVDLFKKFVCKDDSRIGGVVPELISTVGRGKSYIRENRNRIREFLYWMLLDCKNTLICLFK